MSILNTHDMEMIESAKKLLKKLYQEGKHHVAAAVRTKSGKVYTAVNLEAYVGRAAVCAEAIVLGKAILKAIGNLKLLLPYYQTVKGLIPVWSPHVECAGNW